jgi:diguanylate cyclase (GGDEF)-like protein
VASRIKGQVQALNFPVLARMGASRITVSIGIATVAPGEQTDLASLFDTADRALMEAKRTGKNRVLARTSVAS